MTDEVFLDTSFVIARISTLDQHHSQALVQDQKLRQSNSRLITTQAVLLEIGNTLAKLRYRADAVRTISAILADPTVSVLPLTPKLFATGFQFFCARPDKEWGLVDCVSFVVMQERGIAEALTSDEHFEQAGFIALLRH